MTETLEPTQADPLVDHLRACYSQAQEEQLEAWKRHANTFPGLRIWLSRLTRPTQENFRNAPEAIRATREFGALVAARTGLSRGVQLLQQIRLYQKYRMPPTCYYFLGMYEEQIRRKARFFLSDKSTSTLLYYLSNTAPDEEYAPLHGKVAFWKHCRNHGLATVPVLAVFKQGSIYQDKVGISEALPSRDLFSKPATSFLGQGARSWIYNEDGSFTDGTGRTYTPQAVIDTLKKQSKEGALLLQPRMCDHPRLRELMGNRGPSILRIVTIRSPGSPPKFFAGFLNGLLKKLEVPSFIRGTALVARVERNSGKLGRPLCRRAAYLLDGPKRHPKTDRQMTGFELPGWEKAKALALQAHETLPSIPCVGWDLMLTAEGPCLLEGNYDCSASQIQMTHQRLLGLTRFAKDISAYLQKAGV